MKPFTVCLVLILIFFSFSGCQEDETVKEFTGRFIKYRLIPGDGQRVEGTVTLKEKADHSTQIVIAITPTGEGLMHPAHLHYGTMLPDAAMAAMLHPVDGATGKSITDLTILMDDTTITYEELLTFDGHIKVHLDDGPHKSTIIAYANIGKNNDAVIEHQE